MKLLGQGTGIVLIAVTGVLLFALLNFSLLGIIAAGFGLLIWWAISRILTKHESPMRGILTWLFPYGPWISDVEAPAIPGQVDSITARAMGGARAEGREES